MASWKSHLWTATRIILIFVLLYFFICSLDLMSAAFKLLTGKGASSFLSDEDSPLSNPVVGLMIGILGTVCVQSSSTFTSIIVSMVGAGAIPVETAIPMVMGANIGTSVTNTIVSLTQVGDRAEFGRAFSAATVHDMFNWCTVLIMLPLEVASGFLEWLSLQMADGLVDSGGQSEIVILEAITDPFTDLIIQIDSDCFDYVALTGYDNCTLQKRYCPEDNLEPIESTLNYDYIEPECKYLFNLFDLEDWAAGLILLIISLISMIVALLFMVKILNSLLKGAMANVVHKVLNPKWDSWILNYCYGYFNILVGAFFTFIVQSSSVFTSTLTPLVGIGIIAVETVYPLFLGSNIGTTTTSLLAALTNTGEGLHNALQISFVHLMFNICGILLYYPIPFMRIPLPLCKLLGRTTAQYRWFAIMYLIVMFLLLPGLIMVCSLNLIVFYCTIIPLFILLLIVVLINVAQRKFPSVLPRVLRNWDFLPLAMHSLDPLDRVIAGWPCCKKCNADDEGDEKEKIDPFKEPRRCSVSCSESDSDVEMGKENMAYEFSSTTKEKEAQVANYA